MTDQTDRKDPARPLIGVGAVVWHDGKVLLVRRGKPPKEGEWSLPGGAQELGETVNEALIREVFEETSVQIENIRFLEIVDLIIPGNIAGKPRYHYTLLDFSADAAPETITPVPGDDAVSAIWANPDTLETYGLWARTIEVIKKSRQLRKC
ncbi:NUDIX hydrolase [uncultured Thalassospira sp.]|jgi:ADP-ribose pyrophosphatase YjhB (NUDIX family)|uniref:NUDIX hydrolase n=1 Tax=uncultured Thalassospira sp. TaxID=404382 RepID=UPI0030D9E8AF|tara:strand:+ start:19711 stop:20163 length:453 start_codon:yes stop_codon:yes gene_type:complete